MAMATHGEPVAWKLARPVRREGRRDHLPRGRQALCSYSTFPVGPHHCDLDGGRETGDDRPRTRRAGTKWKAAGDGFFASRCKAGGGGKKLAADVAGDERGEAGLRSDPCQSRSRMERPFQEIGGIRQWQPSLAPHARERKRRRLHGPTHHHPDPRRHGHARPWARRMHMRPCSRTLAA